MSIVLNQDPDSLRWQFVVVGPNGGTLCTSQFDFEVPEIALAYAQRFRHGVAPTTDGE